jgi:hypothetical protein
MVIFRSARTFSATSFSHSTTERVAHEQRNAICMRVRTKVQRIERRGMRGRQRMGGEAGAEEQGDEDAKRGTREEGKAESEGEQKAGRTETGTHAQGEGRGQAAEWRTVPLCVRFAPCLLCLGPCASGGLHRIEMSHHLCMRMHVVNLTADSSLNPPFILIRIGHPRNATMMHIQTPSKRAVVRIHHRTDTHTHGDTENRRAEQSRAEQSRAQHSAAGSTNEYGRSVPLRCFNDSATVHRRTNRTSGDPWMHCRANRTDRQSDDDSARRTATRSSHSRSHSSSDRCTLHSASHSGTTRVESAAGAEAETENTGGRAATVGGKTAGAALEASSRRRRDTGRDARMDEEGSGSRASTGALSQWGMVCVCVCVCVYVSVAYSVL